VNLLLEESGPLGTGAIVGEAEIRLELPPGHPGGLGEQPGANGLFEVRVAHSAASLLQSAEDEEDDQRPDYGHDESGGMDGLSLPGLGEEPRDESSDHRADDADEGGLEETHVLGAGHDGASEETDEKTDDDRPDDVQHMFLSFSGFVMSVFFRGGEVNEGGRLNPLPPDFLSRISLRWVGLRA
jgi:hypothetical protein